MPTYVGIEMLIPISYRTFFTVDLLAVRISMFVVEAVQLAE